MKLQDDVLGTAIRKAQAQYQAEQKVQPKGSRFAWGAAPKGHHKASADGQFDGKRYIGGPELNLCITVWYQDQILFLTCKLGETITYMLQRDVVRVN